MTGSESLGYLYFIIHDVDMQKPDDVMIRIKIGRTEDPRKRMYSYISHYFSEALPIYYKIWKVQDAKLEETWALEHFKDRRIVKTGKTSPSEVICATKAEIDAYKPRNPQGNFLAPDTMMPTERQIVEYEITQLPEEHLEEPGEVQNSVVTEIVEHETTRPSEEYLEEPDEVQNGVVTEIATQLPEEHWKELSEIQKDVVTEIVDFLRTKKKSDSLARKLQAPCGTGKTHMTCEALRLASVENSDLKACILCPTKLIAEQWQANLHRVGIIAPILIKSKLQEKNGEAQEGRFYIVTYASCTVLLPDSNRVYVFDEAHHTCGIIDGDNGVTKRFVNETATAGCRRLFLTFTPKTFADGMSNSMDDVSLYGTSIPFPSMKSLVDKGLMPDYRLALTRRMDMVEGISRYMPQSKKIIVCLKNVEAIEEVEEYLRDLGENVFAVHGKMSDKQVTQNIKNFNKGEVSERSWLLSCLILLEGADIPIADTVILLAPWKTKVRLIQLLLRPGRWYPKKTSFNIVVPLNDKRLIEDMLRIAGFEITDDKTCHWAATQETADEPSDPEVVRDETHLEVATQETTDESSDLEVAHDETHSEVATQETTDEPSDLEVATQETTDEPSDPEVAAQRDTAKPSSIEVVRKSRCIWCVSCTDGKDIGPTCSRTTFGVAQFVDVQTCFCWAKPGEIVIFMAKSYVAFASISKVWYDDKTEKMKSFEVDFLPVKCVLRGPGADKSDDDTKRTFLTMAQYTQSVNDLWRRRDDKYRICSTDTTGFERYSKGARYQTYRRDLIMLVLDRRY
jgi:superfamily II DNA or RNA helicase